ncbi:hypothetical protein D3C73_1112180 [compost metagenome]
MTHLVGLVAEGHARLDDDVEVELQRPGNAVIPHGAGQQDAVGAIQPRHGVGDDPPGVFGLRRDLLAEDGRELAKGVFGLEARQVLFEQGQGVDLFIRILFPPGRDEAIRQRPRRRPFPLRAGHDMKQHDVSRCVGCSRSFADLAKSFVNLFGNHKPWSRR